MLNLMKSLVNGSEIATCEWRNTYEIYHRNLERYNTKHVNMSEKFGIGAKIECSL